LASFAVICTQGAAAVRGVSGTLHFKTGRTLEFDYLGTTGNVVEYVLEGSLQGQDVSYSFVELGQIIFHTTEASSDKPETGTPARLGEVIIVSKEGKRFTLQDCRLRSAQNLAYVYADPVTGKPRGGSCEFSELSDVAFGKHSGTMKVNPMTGEFFPSVYIYDPFTGRKLLWSDHNAAIVAPKPKPATVESLREEMELSEETPTPAAAQPVRTEWPSEELGEPGVYAPGGKTNLELTVTTPSVAFELFSAGIDLKVVLKGPEKYERVVEDTQAAKDHLFQFKGIPSGDYTVIATYGNRTTMDIIRVTGSKFKFHVVFD